MRKNKHFRSDVVLARVIFLGVCALIMAAIVFIVSLLLGPSEKDRDTENTEGQKIEETQESEGNVTLDTEIESETESETESEAEIVYYVKPFTEVRFRAEPNTDSTTIAKIPEGTLILLIEELDGWFYVEYEGQQGYISADYAEIIQGTADGGL